MVVVIVPFTNCPYFSALLEGMVEEAFESHYKLVFIQTNYEEAREIEALEMLKHRRLMNRMSKSGIRDIDQMDGFQFEVYLEALFKKLGYHPL
jgi:HJR/Mrr/RecB family endonuclease